MSTYERRNELARMRGFRNYAEQRRYGAHVRNIADLDRQPPAAQQSREQVLNALAVARREGIELDEAARREGTTIDAIRFWAEDAVHRRNGRWEVAPSDRLFRAMFVYSNGQPVEVSVRGSRKASIVGKYHVAVRRFRDTNDDGPLRQFTGVTVDGVELETDTDVLEQMFRRGSFSFDDIYRMVW